MRIGALASRSGVSATRIRFYEDRGLLPPPSRTENGYRSYDDNALRTLLFIDRARCLGFSLPKIETHLASPQDPERKARLLAAMESRLRELDDEAARIEAQRKDLAGFIGEVKAGLKAA